MTLASYLYLEVIAVPAGRFAEGTQVGRPVRSTWKPECLAGGRLATLSSRGTDGCSRPVGRGGGVGSLPLAGGVRLRQIPRETSPSPQGHFSKPPGSRGGRHQGPSVLVGSCGSGWQ